MASPEELQAVFSNLASLLDMNLTLLKVCTTPGTSCAPYRELTVCCPSTAECAHDAR